MIVYTANSPPTLVTKNVVSNSNFEALQKNTTICVDVSNDVIARMPVIDVYCTTVL